MRVKKIIPLSAVIGHRSTSGGIFNAQWNDKFPLSLWKNDAVCKKACFTHGKWISYAKPRLLLTVLTKTVFPCVKTPLLLTANWLRVWKGRFYSRDDITDYSWLPFVHEIGGFYGQNGLECSFVHEIAGFCGQKKLWRCKSVLTCQA